MTTFERKLRKICVNCRNIQNPKFVGRSCIGRLDDGIVVKMKLESTMIRDKYNALRINILYKRTLWNVAFVNKKVSHFANKKMSQL